jgi:hypothetical protein
MKHHEWVHTPKYDFDFDASDHAYNLYKSYAFICSVCHVRIHTSDGNPPVQELLDNRYFWDCDLCILHEVHDN